MLPDRRSSSLRATPRRKHKQPPEQTRGRPPLDTNRTITPDGEIQDTPLRGSVSEGRCPKAGYVILEKGTGRLILPTSCKTWSCNVCQKNLMSYFKMRVKVGLSLIGQSNFTTITYKTKRHSLQDAGFAQRDWKALIKSLAFQPPNQWLKVTELTKAKMPHHHLVSNAGTRRPRCYGIEFEIREFKRRFETCECYSHEMSRVWYSITGDSYICHVTPVTSHKSSGSYLAKYMMKKPEDRMYLEAVYQVKRRFSSSRGWPAGARVRLNYSKPVGPGWDRVSMIPGRGLAMVKGGPSWMQHKRGDVAMLAMSKRRSEGAARAAVERRLGNAKNVRTEDVTRVNGDWGR